MTPHPVHPRTPRRVFAKREKIAYTEHGFGVRNGWRGSAMEGPVASDAVAERRRAVMTMAGAGGVVVLALVLPGALAWWHGVAAFASLCVLACLYLISHAAGDRSAARGEGLTPVDVEPGETATSSVVFGEMLETMPDPVLLIGSDMRLEAANAAARAEFSLARSRVLLSAVLREPSVLDAVRAVRDGAPPSDVEYRTVGPQERFMRAYVAALPGGDAPRAMVVFHDDTAVKRAERSRTDFLANASHELRTPLASLTGFIETLRGHARDDTQARDKFLTIMEDQAERMRGLIDDLLSLSRVELNEHVPPSGTANLGQVARDVVDAMAPLASERGVRVEVEGADDAGVIGDRHELSQVIQNLLENALKYSPRGGVVTMNVSGGRVRGSALSGDSVFGEDGGRTALLSPPERGVEAFAAVSVRDHGQGIARKHLPRLGERFFRAEGGVTPDRSGTGLGLAIVKHILSRHRGGLVVDSAQGAGTVVTAFVPETLELGDVRSDASAQAAFPRAAAAPAEG